jgi:C4-dicarboxylate transporter DctM subunit
MTWTLFGILFLLLAVGFPIAVALGGAASLFLFLQTHTPLEIVAQRIVSGVDSFPLLALPFFLLAGLLMERAGITSRIMNLANALVGHIRGGLAAVCVVASCFFGFISGSGVADTAAIGSIIMPEMVRRGYGKGFTASLQAASGVLGIVIPPSLPIVVLGVAGGVPIGALLLGGILPGWIAGLLLMLVAIIISRKRGYQGVERTGGWKETWKAAREAVLPLLTPVIILGGILGGVFTPTESAAVATVYALLLGLFVYRSLRIRDLYPIFKEAALTSAAIMFIIAAASPFAWIMAINQIPESLTTFFLTLTSNPFWILMLVNALLLVLGTFMETIALIIIMAPILLPLITSLGYDPVYFGIIMTLNLAIGGITPPLGVCLITTCRLLKIPYPPPGRDLLPFMLAMVVSLFLTILFPPLVLWLGKMA